MAFVDAGAPPAGSVIAPVPVGRAAERAARLERWLVALVALHSVLVGVMLLFAPAWSVAFAGWEGVDPLFFPRQGGAFHFVVAFAYLYEHRRLGTVTILAVTKTFACLFLLSMVAVGEAAWAVAFSGLTDGLMGAAVLAFHRWRLALSRRAA